MLDTTFLLINDTELPPTGKWVTVGIPTVPVTFHGKRYLPGQIIQGKKVRDTDGTNAQLVKMRNDPRVLVAWAVPVKGH